MPDWKLLVRERLAGLNVNGVDETTLVDEIAELLEDQYRELRSAGATDDEAKREVLAGIDDVKPLHDWLARSRRREPSPIGDESRGSLFDQLRADVRYAFRAMRRSPLFVAVVLFTLALGIGANTTVFTLVNTLILNPLPVREPGELAAINIVQTQNGGKTGAPLPISLADFRDYQLRNQSFLSVAGYTSVRGMSLRTENGTERIFAEFVTGNYFSTLGINPSLGRFFSDQEDTAPGAHPVAVISYGTWRARFGGSPDVIGKTLRINSSVLTIIGVASPGFIGVNSIFGPDAWIPAVMSEQLLPNEMHAVLTDRTKALFQGAGRLRPGVNLRQAGANLHTLASDLAQEFPAADEGHDTLVRPIRDALFASSGTTSATPMLLGTAVLLAVVGIVLLIACSNVANLMLARSSARQQEMAVRLALGASRSRLLRQLLTESVLLGLLSGLLGVGVGYLGLRATFNMLPNGANFIQPKMDATVFGFALAISLFTGLLFGLVPAFKASNAQVAEALKEEARTAGRSRRKVTAANALLVAQVSFSFLLLVTAALFLRSMGRAYQLDPGFQTAHLAVFLTSPGQAGFSKPQTKAFYKEVRDRVSSDPAIESVSWSSNLPLWSRGVNGLLIEGRQQRSQSEKITTILNTVDVGYFHTAGVAIDRGRAFNELDRETSLPVAIVNEKLARDYWPGGNAIGKRIQLPGETVKREIVGIARTSNYSSWAEAPQACVFVPFEQNFSDSMTLYVRTKGDPGTVLTTVQGVIRAVGPQVLAKDVRTGREIIEGGLFQAKVGVGLLGIFGLLALGLASIGLYGIMAYSVNQRRREIGLRMAIGAASASVLRLILRQGLALVLVGMAIGFAGTLLTGRILSRMLYGVSASDPLSVAGAAVFLMLVAAAACYLPARKASRLDPLDALRES